MAVKPLVRPYIMKNATFKVVDDDYTAHVMEVRFTPSVQTATWRGIGGNVIKDQSPADWSCVTGILQDTDEDGLHRYFFDHQGETKNVLFSPVAGGPEISAAIIIAPPDLGGAAGTEFATASITHGVTGAPTYVTATTP